LDSDVCEIIEAFVSKEDRQTKERQFRR
jgi:hypothetical protein